MCYSGYYIEESELIQSEQFAISFSPFFCQDILKPSRTCGRFSTLHETYDSLCPDLILLCVHKTYSRTLDWVR